MIKHPTKAGGFWFDSSQKETFLNESKLFWMSLNWKEKVLKDPGFEPAILRSTTPKLSGKQRRPLPRIFSFQALVVVVVLVVVVSKLSTIFVFSGFKPSDIWNSTTTDFFPTFQTLLLFSMIFFRSEFDSLEVHIFDSGWNCSASSFRDPKVAFLKCEVKWLRFFFLGCEIFWRPGLIFSPFVDTDWAFLLLSLPLFNYSDQRTHARTHA